MRPHSPMTTSPPAVIDIQSKSSLQDETNTGHLTLPAIITDKALFVHPTLDVQSKRPIIEVNDKRSKSNIHRINQSRMSGTLTVVPVIINASGVYPDTWKHNCWWCSHKFKSKPVGCPVKFTRKTNSYHMRGFFCSCNCAKAWGCRNLPTHEKNNVGTLMVHLAIKMAKANKVEFDLTEFHANTITAPHYSNIITFGGHLTIQQFRKQHCLGTTLVSIPQTTTGIQLIPLGYNVFKLDNSQSIHVSRPTHVTSSSKVRQKKPIKNVNKAVLKRTKQTRKTQCFAMREPKPMKSRNVYQVSKSVRDTQNTERLAMHKKVRVVPVTQKSIGSMMNLKYT